MPPVKIQILTLAAIAAGTMVVSMEAITLVNGSPMDEASQQAPAMQEAVGAYTSCMADDGNSKPTCRARMFERAQAAGITAQDAAAALVIQEERQKAGEKTQ